MGCENTINNSGILNNGKIQNFIESYKIIRQIKNSIYNNNEADAPLKVYLISTNSIPQYIRLINNNINNIDKIKENEENCEINENRGNVESAFTIIRELGKYEPEIYDYQLCEDIISKNNNEKNEFIIVNENFLKIMNMKIPEKNDRTVELKYYKTVSKIQMTFPKSHETVFIVEKSENINNYIFKFSMPNDPFNPKNTLINGNIITNEYCPVNPINPINPINNTSIVSVLQAHNKKKKEEIINNTIDLLPLLYCIINMRILREKLLINKNKILSLSNSISKEIYNLIDTIKENEDLLKKNNYDNFRKIIGDQKDKYDSKKLVNILFWKMHNELNIKNINNIFNNIISDNTNLLNELYNLRNKFRAQNESIMTDIFLFEEIKLTQCTKCNIVICGCSINYYFTFTLDKVKNFKLQNNNNGFEYMDLNDCFNLLTSNELVYNFNCPKCYNINNCFSCIRFNDHPEILTIILDWNNNYKNDIKFNIDFIFDINNYLYKWENVQNKYTKYELIGMLSYFNENSKHCAIFKSYNNNNWYIYNNFNLTIIKDIYNENKGKPYLLFYQKTNY